VSGWDSFWAHHGPTAFVVLGVLALAELGWLIYVHLRLKRALMSYSALLVGTEGANLESLLHTYADQVKHTASKTEGLTTDTIRLSKGLQGCLQRFGVIRFNPFSDVGGNQSFAIALTDAVGNGFVLSSLHHRDRTQVYAKPLVNWTSPYALSDEEASAIEMAHNDHS
jgi:hypothetical protein